MARTIVGLFALGWVLTAVGTVQAQSATSNFTVSASVANRCTISTTSIAFGTYDPVVDHATTPLDAQGTVTIQCTRNTVATVGLNGGANSASATSTTRAMQGGGGGVLDYEIYRDASRATFWGNVAGDLLTPPAAPNAAPRVFPTYGRIPPGQDVAPGNYTDTVTATVNF